MLYAFLFCFLCFVLACLGAGIIFFVKNTNGKLEAFLNAFAAGVMMASSIFSLIIPAIDYCGELNMPDYIILPCCFVVGGLIYIILEIMTKRKKRRDFSSSMLILGIGLHNIPEGMCVGLAFATASILNTHGAFMSAVMIAVGIGIQNIPEGSSVAFPLYSKGITKTRAFLMSALVQFIEVPAGIIAYLIGTNFISVFPFMLAFSSALVMLVAVCDIFPESLSNNRKIAFISMLIGFIVMMTLDLALGW